MDTTQLSLYLEERERLAPTQFLSVVMSVKDFCLAESISAKRHAIKINVSFAQIMQCKNANAAKTQKLSHAIL